MLKKGKPTQVKKGQYLRKDSSFNIRDLVMRTPTSSSPDRSPDIYNEEKQIKITKQDLPPKPTLAELLKADNGKLEEIIQELKSFDVGTIQRRSDPKMKALTGRINDTIAEIFGRNTDEYDNHVIYSLDTLPMTIGGSWHPLPEVREGYQKGIRSAITKLSSLLAAQGKKLEALSSEKSVSPVSREPIANPVITTNEKVSLVNLRGKIRSKEISILTNGQHTNGHGQTPRLLISDAAILEDTVRLNLYENSYDPNRVKEKKAPDGHGDQKSVKGISRDRKNVVLLENLEEKLKKLEEEMPALGEFDQEGALLASQETNIAPVQNDRENELFGEPSREATPLATIMAKLNEIVSNEPEYTEAYAKMVPGKEEIVMPMFEDGDRTSVAVHGEALHGTFTEIARLESSGLEVEEEVLIIDGDDVLSSEPNFIDVLEAKNVAQETVGPAQQNGNAYSIPDGRNRISLEALEEKLREFEEKDVARKDLPKDFELTGDEEVLLIDSAGDLPEEMMNELVQEAGMVEACEEEFYNEEVLVIDGDEELSQEPISLESIDERPQKEKMAVANEEILVIDCDSGLPEDVSDELPNDESLCDNREEKPQEIAGSSMPLQSDAHLVSSQTDCQLIIDLMSQATLLDLSLHDRDEHTIKAVLLEDLELRFGDYDSLQPTQEYFNTVQLYDVEEDEALPEEKEENAHSAEKHCVDCTDPNKKQPEDSSMVVFFGHDILANKPVNEGIIEPIMNVSLEHESPGLRFTELPLTEGNADLMLDVKEVSPVESNHESQTGNTIVEYEVLELSETTVYGEISNLELQQELFSPEWNGIRYYEATLDLIENALFSEPAEKVPVEEQGCAELSEQILLNDMASLPDYKYETFITLPVDLFAFEPTLMDAHDVMILQIGTEECGTDVLPDVEDVDQVITYSSGEEVPEEAMFVVSSEEPTKETAQELTAENETIRMELSEHSVSAHEHLLIDDELIKVGEEEEFISAASEGHLDETALLDANDPQTSEVPQSDSDQIGAVSILKELDCELALSCPKEDQAIEPLQVENNIEIPIMYNMEELTQAEERKELSLPEVNNYISTDEHDAFPHNAALECIVECEPVDLLGGSISETELLPLDAFEKSFNDPECNVTSDNEIEESSRDTILLEALEEMLSNLETSIPEQVDHPVKGKTQSDPQPKEEQMLVIESHKEPPLKAVLINTKEERNNPFAVTDFGKDKPHSKTLRADDLQAQISELRYRIDDLKTFDIDSIEQRFDPRVRALGDTVNNTLSEIFGRNTPAYWQHALPSLDSLPVVVGGPKFSQEELRDAYRRRINDAISKVNVTIDVLEAKLGNLGDKGSGGQVLFFAPKAPKYPDIQSLR